MESLSCVAIADQADTNHPIDSNHAFRLGDRAGRGVHSREILVKSAHDICLINTIKDRPASKLSVLDRAGTIRGSWQDILLSPRSFHECLAMIAPLKSGSISGVLSPAISRA